MAEYKGLTIRIGGDTSQLNTALKASTKSAAALESQIRQITRAMRFDPADFGNLNTRMKLSENRMESLYSKLKLVRNGYKELGKEVVTVGGEATTVKELAKATRNVELAAKAADRRYEDVTGTLAAMYREFEKLGTASIKNALNMDGADEKVEAVISKFRELGIIVRDADKDVDRIKLDLSDAGRVADIDELLVDLRTLGALTSKQIADNRQLRATFNRALGDKEAYDNAAKFRKMGVDMQRIRSEAEGMAASMRAMNNVSTLAANKWAESNARIKSMDAALSDCTKQANAYEAALRENPANLSAALGRLRALSSELSISEDKARELSAQIADYKSRLSDVLAKQKNLPMFIQQAGDEWEKMQVELAEARGEANKLRESFQRIKDNPESTAEEIRELKAELREADARVDELVRDARKIDDAFESSKECAELQQLQAELAQTESHAASLRKRMDMTSLGGKSFLNASTIKSAGMTLYSTLTPAITMLGWRAVSAAQDIDSAYRDMRKTVNGTETQFQELRDAAIEFSKTHVTSADQILQIEAIGGELGIATDALQLFAETVSNLEVATNLDTEEAATSLGKLANITHMGADEYDNYADALVRLGNNGASTEDQIVDIATRIGSMGTIVGMSVPEILALSSSIASTGMKTEAAGTAISNTFSDIESAVAGGGDRLEQFASVAGVSAEEFAASWREHPIQAFKAFIQGLNRIEADGGSATATLESMKITGERQKQSILGLMQTIDGLDDNLTMSTDAWNGQSDAWGAAGDAAREADKKAEGFSGQLKILANIGNDALASLAEGATPIIAAFTDIAKAALDAFDEMDDGAKTGIVALLGVGAAIGPMLTVVSTLITAGQNIKAFVTESSAMGKALRLMKAGFVDAGGEAGGFRAQLGGLKEGAKSLGTSLLKGLAAGAVVAGITLVIMAVVDLAKKMKESEQASRNAGDVIGSAMEGAAKDSEKSFGEISTSYDDMVSKLAESNKRIQENADETYGNTANIEHYADSLKAALDAYNNGDRSAASMANLKTQLELYNSAAGESISFTETETGRLELMRDGAALTREEFDKLTNSILANTKAQFFQESYASKMGDYRDALSQMEAAESKVEDIQAKIKEAEDARQYGTVSDLTQDLGKAQEELEKTRAKVYETTDAMTQFEEGMNLMAEAQLENASAAVKWVAGNDELQVALWDNGNSVTEFAHNLETLGVSYDDMQKHADGIKQVARNWDGSVDGMIKGLEDLGIEIDDVNKQNLKDKKAKVKVETRELKDAQGNVYVWNGTQLLDKNGNAVVDSRSLSDAQGKMYTWNGTQLEDKSATLHVAITGAFQSAIDFMKTWNSWSPGQKQAFISGVNSATGSVASTPYIPRHAAGYIATGPTLTNNGWVGEAGAEAVLNWGTGGAVVPLTNTKYMQPIAGAIAKEMGTDDHSVTYNVTIDGVTVNDNAAIRGAVMTLIDEARVSANARRRA